jgi:tetracycline resistance efflux pump
MDYGIISLLPPLVVVITGIWLKRAFEPLLLGCVVGYAIIAYYNLQNPDFQVNTHQFPTNFIHGLKQALMQEDMVWIILVCGLYGSLIHLIIQSGGVFAFGELALKYVKSRRSALVVTWLLGLFIFIDDYMSALATGVTMRKITDRFQISREMLAVMVGAMAAPICLLVPMTTWSIYCGKLLEDNNVVAKGDAFSGFVATIPFMFYPMLAVIIAFLLAIGKFPLLGSLKIAEESARNTQSVNYVEEKINNEVENATSSAKSIHFFLPLIFLISATLYLEKDALKGVLAGMVFTFCYYLLAKIMTFAQLSDGIFDGFKSMIYALAILTMSYVLKRVGDEMGLTIYVIESAKPFLSKAILPMIVFLVLSFISYTTASSWGLYAVAIPIIVPLAQAVGANVWLSLAAVFSCGGFGSHASFFSDATVLTAESTECNNMKISYAMLPYNLIALAVSSLLFLLFGYFI